MAKLLRVVLLLILCLIFPRFEVEAREIVGGREIAQVDLFVICDRKFAAQFKNDNDSLASFWYIQMADLNNRLKTLQKVDIKVRVVDLVVAAEKQLSIGAFPHALKSWLYKKQTASPKFDMALVVLGENIDFDVDDFSGSASPGRMCMIDHSSKLLYSFVLLKTFRGDQTFPELLAESIVKTIVPKESMMEIKSCKNSQRFLMGNSFSPKRFFYSKCADDALFAQISKKQTPCILDKNLDATDILDKYSNVRPTTLNEQCISRWNTGRFSEKVSAKHDSESCKASECESISFRFMTFVPEGTVGSISPVDNTECDTNKFCFKGLCLPRGEQIRNVNQQKCLSSASWFEGEDNASLIPCKTKTLMETLRIDHGITTGKRIAKAYGIAYTTKVLYKCLTVDENTLHVHFTNCDDKGANTWQFIRAKPMGNVFKLFHGSSRSYVFVNEMRDVVASPFFNLTDSNFLWELEDKSTLSKFIESIIQAGTDLIQQIKSSNQESKKFNLGDWLSSLFT